MTPTGQSIAQLDSITSSRKGQPDQLSLTFILSCKINNKAFIHNFIAMLALDDAYVLLKVQVHANTILNNFPAILL